jgi:hypothetical protein
MKSEMSAIHMPIEIAIIIFVLFQMAILQRFIDRFGRERDHHNTWETYTRSTISSEERAKAR